MDNIMSDVVSLIRGLASLSRVDNTSLFIKLENNAIYVNDVTYEFHNRFISNEDIAYILSEFRNMGAEEYLHTDDAVCFKDASLILESSVRN